MKQKKIKYKVGQSVYYIGERYTIHKILDLNAVLLLSNKRIFVRAALNDISIVPVSTYIDKNDAAELQSYSAKQWEIAKERLSIIKPIIDLRLPVIEIRKIAKKSKTSIPTIYRWINRYNDNETLSSLIPLENNAGKGKSRLNEEVESIINAIIHKEYLNPQKIRPSKLYEKLLIECKNAQITPPNVVTVRRRIKAISEYITQSKREDKKTTEHVYKPIKGKFPGANHPLAVVQIDHTLLDIILVDEKNRQTLGRPWITLAIDVFSALRPFN